MLSFSEIRQIGSFIFNNAVLATYWRPLYNDFINGKYEKASNKIIFNTSVNVNEISEILHVEFVFAGNINLDNRRIVACYLEISNGFV